MVKTAPPHGYVIECGPRSLAAATGLPIEEAARILWGHRTPPVRWQFEGTYGTWPHDIGEALVRLGYAVELFDGGGVQWLNAEAYNAFLAWRAHKRTTEIIRIPHDDARKSRSRRDMGYATPAPRPGLNKSTPDAEDITRPLTVAGWLRTFPASTWIIFVRGHVLAASAGKIITDGDDHYRRHHVWDALRASKL